MIPIPEELLGQIERGNVLLFIGERIIRDAQGQVVLDQLAAQLAARCELDAEAYAFPEVAQVYEDDKGRNALVRFVREQVEALGGDQPLQIHRLIARLTDCNVLVTTCFDRRLERAFEDRRRSLDVIIGNLDVAFEDERKARLYKLRGSVDRAESLVLTEDDYETFFEDQASISVVLQGYLARKTILFLGYDLADRRFQRLYRKVITPLDKYARLAYALFVGSPSLLVSSWCKRRGIHAIDAEPMTFLETLSDNLATRTRSVSDVPPRPIQELILSLPERPYKLLDHYEAKDSAIFFGRREETQTLTSLIHAHRLVLLYGASGVGKTSLLQAGVIPRLEEANSGYAVFNVRAFADPLTAICTHLRRELPNAPWPADEAPLVNYVTVVARTHDRYPVIIIDQFEEFFARFDPEFRTDFIAELGALYDARDLPIKVVLSLREDCLANVTELENRIPEIFAIKMRLLPLTRGQAQEAIACPARMLDYTYEPELIERLLDDLAHEKEEVLPFQLQLVCDALFNRACTKGHKILTMQDYKALGGIQEVLYKYLDKELHRFLPEERDLARRVLEALVASDLSRKVERHARLLTTLNADEALLNRVLAKLLQARLVRRAEHVETNEFVYEMTHDYLAEKIASQLSQDVLKTKRARELLNQQMKIWKHTKLRIPLEALKLLHEQHDSLEPFTTEELELIFRSALATGFETTYWFKRARQGNVNVDTIALQGLKSDDFRVRAIVTTTLGELKDEAFINPLAEMLSDLYPQVRVTAICALESYGTSKAWQALLDNLAYEAYVPAGEFIMGDDDTDENDDKPAHRIHVDAFYAGRYPITYAEYKRYMNDIGRTFEIPEGKADHPVTSISWQDAHDYADWAGMRMLTEAEWEKAASWDEKKEVKRRFPWGDQFDESCCNTRESGTGDTTPVGQYSPEGDSPYGCADMAGNVWEWTSNFYRGYPYQTDDGREDLSGPGSRVLRGGSFYLGQGVACTTYRRWNLPGKKGKNIGGRMGVTASPPASL